MIQDILKVVSIVIYILVVLISLIMTIKKYKDDKKAKGEATTWQGYTDVIINQIPNLIKDVELVLQNGGGLIKSQYVKSIVSAYCTNNGIPYNEELFNTVINTLVNLMNYYKTDESEDVNKSDGSSEGISITPEDTTEETTKTTSESKTLSIFKAVNNNGR